VRCDGIASVGAFGAADCGALEVGVVGAVVCADIGAAIISAVTMTVTLTRCFMASTARD